MHTKRWKFHVHGIVAGLLVLATTVTVWGGDESGPAVLRITDARPATAADALYAPPPHQGADAPPSPTVDGAAQPMPMEWIAGGPMVYGGPLHTTDRAVSYKIITVGDVINGIGDNRVTNWLEGKSRESSFVRWLSGQSVTVGQWWQRQTAMYYARNRQQSEHLNRMLFGPQPARLGPEPCRIQYYVKYKNVQPPGYYYISQTSQTMPTAAVPVVSPHAANQWIKQPIVPVSWQPPGGVGHQSTRFPVRTAGWTTLYDQAHQVPQQSVMLAGWSKPYCASCGPHRTARRPYGRHRHVPGRGCWQCKLGYFIPTGCGGTGCKPYGKYSMVYPVNRNYFDARDGGVYAAQGYGVPMTVPLAAPVEYTYNYSWGVPSSRLTPISRPAP